uniref:ubiquitin carboxyl-terminal hydrolase 8-like isoform X2 n=1 Tax=Myxine glutinosa TaxID=7769 RepID=UPI00358DDFF4
MPVLTASGGCKELYLSTSLDALNQKAEVKLEKQINIQRKIESAQKVFHEAERLNLEQDEEKAYVLYMKFCNLVTHIRNTAEFHQDKELLEHKKSSEKKLETVPKGSITPKQLFHLLKDGKETILLIDSREEDDFLASQLLPSLRLLLKDDFRMESATVINIPQCNLRPGVTVGMLEGQFQESFREHWQRRSAADHLILLDWSSRMQDVAQFHPLACLRDALYKWDSETCLRNVPLVLEGGYEAWLLYYPMYSTNPKVQAPRLSSPPTGILLEDLSYPSLERPPPATPSASLVPLDSLSSNTDIGDLVNSEVTVHAEHNEQIVAQTEPKKTTKDDHLTSKIPQVDRSTKPAQRLEDLSIGIMKEEERGPDSVKDKELFKIESKGQEKDGPLVEGPGCKESERMNKENVQVDLQNRIDMENVEKRGKEENIIKREKDVAKKEKEEQQKKERDKMVARLRQHRLDKEQKDRGNEHGSGESVSPRSDQDFSETAQTERLEKRNHGEMKKEEKEEEEGGMNGPMILGSSIDQPVLTDEVAGERSFYPPGVGGNESRNSRVKHIEEGYMRPKLHRSFSSPNVAKLGSPNEATDPVPSSVPTVDRSAKPNIQAKLRPSPSALRARDLNPTYGGLGGGRTGLRNLGNTCYMNSVLQCLSSTTPLAQHFVGNQYVDDINKKNALGYGGALAEEFAVLVQALWSGQYRSISPRDFKSQIGRVNTQFSGFQQQDSQELLVFLLDGLNEDLNRAKREHISQDSSELLSDADAAHLSWEAHSKLNASVVVDLFHGQFKSTLQCASCKKKSHTFEAFACLSLPIPSGNNKYTLEDCLRQFSQTELLTGSNRCQCSKCKCNRDHEKTLEIWKLPPILVIHLKRFCYEGRWRQKLQNNVSFPTKNLDLTNYVIKGTRSPKYNLYCISNHYGSLDGGHYTAFCQIAGSHNWFKFDDHEVETLFPEQIHSPAAYILFYSSMEQCVPQHSL